MTSPELRPHQRDAVRAAVSQLTSGSRTLVVMACGTGKTWVGAAVSSEVAPEGKVLVVVPSLPLLAQTAASYARYLGSRAGRIGAVCTDAAATAQVREMHTDLDRLHAGVTTDPAEVAAWLRRPGRATILTTYASLPAIRAAQALPRVSAWDLVVVDEAHRSAGRAGRTWSLVNDDAAVPATRRLYMTATPRLLSSGEDDVVSMDDEKVFGSEVYRLTFAEAIRQKLLADYRVLVSVVTSDEIAKLTAGKRVLSASGPAVPAPMLAAQVSLLKAAREYDLQRIITYHHRVAGARRFAATLLNAADLLGPEQRPRVIRAGSVDGSMPPDSRREELRHLQDPGDRTVVLANSRVLAEGIDVPDLDAVMFCDPRDSQTDIAQAVGRALRLGSRKSKIATIIIPVVINQAEAPEAALDSSAFATVWRVVRALRAHDERMGAWLDQARVSRAAAGGGGTPELPAWLRMAGTPVDPTFAAALQVRMVDSGSSSWLEGYGHARAFHAEHGHVDVPSAYVTRDGYELGAWLKRQRESRREGTLAADRVDQLDAIGMVWQVLETRWLNGLARLRAFQAEHGHLNVPIDYTDSDEFALGQYVQRLRARRKSGVLERDKVEALDALGFTWSFRDLLWERGLQAATEYHASHGHLSVPSGYTTNDGYPLGNWVKNQRSALSRGTLSADRAAALEKLGVSQESDPRWAHGFQAAVDYHAAHGHINVPLSHPPVNGVDLGAWIQDKRYRRRTGSLRRSQETALKQLGIDWDPVETAWNTRFQALKEFKAVHGHTDVPFSYRIPGGSLGTWLAGQRAAYHKGTLDPSRTAKLEEIGVHWDSPKDRHRNAMIAALRAYVAEAGRDIPCGYVTGDGLKLGAWVDNARRRLLDGKPVHQETVAALRECRVPGVPEAGESSARKKGRRGASEAAS